MPDAPRIPPRFVPTLTEVVGAAPVAPQRGAPPADRGGVAPPAAPAAPVAPAPARPAVPGGEGLDAEIMHAVMQRVDALLEQRLQAVVAASVEAQLPQIAARLRSGVESALRRTVADALADELQRRTSSNG